MVSFQIYQVNAFTDRAFTGNPAAVCLLDVPLTDEQYRLIAAEFRLSETAFVVTAPTAGGDWATTQRFHLRWFTPTVEVPLCGHATLATAAVLFREKKNTNKTVYFDTLSGELVAELDDGKVNSGVAIYLPTAETVPLEESGVVIPQLEAILEAVLGKAAPIKSLNYVPSRKRLLVRLQDGNGGDRPQLEALQPKFDDMLRLHDGSQLSSVTVTTNGQVQPYDFCSRHFSPWVGIPEDPVTGSAHSYIVTYWSKQMDNKREFLGNGKKELFSYKKRGASKHLHWQHVNVRHVEAISTSPGSLTPASALLALPLS